MHCLSKHRPEDDCRLGLSHGDCMPLGNCGLCLLEHVIKQFVLVTILPKRLGSPFRVGESLPAPQLVSYHDKDE